MLNLGAGRTEAANELEETTGRHCEGAKAMPVGPPRRFFEHTPRPCIKGDPTGNVVKITDRRMLSNRA